jgi:ADP-ribose pyrophosphatase
VSDPDLTAPLETMWEGRFIKAMRRGRWEFAARARGIKAVVILAEHEGHYVLVEQPRVAVGALSLELPAGLVGDGEEDGSVEDAARRELEEETGFRAESIESLGEYFASPGMVSESFTLVRATGLTRVGPGGGIPGEEEIAVHLVPRGEIGGFVAGRRRAGVAIDVKLLLLLAPGLLGTRA